MSGAMTLCPLYPLMAWIWTAYFLLHFALYCLYVSHISMCKIQQLNTQFCVLCSPAYFKLFSHILMASYIELVPKFTLLVSFHNYK